MKWEMILREEMEMVETVPTQEVDHIRVLLELLLRQLQRDGLFMQDLAEVQVLLQQLKIMAMVVAVVQELLVDLVLLLVTEEMEEMVY